MSFDTLVNFCYIDSYQKYTLCEKKLAQPQGSIHYDKNSGEIEGAYSFIIEVLYKSWKQYFALNENTVVRDLPIKVIITFAYQ